MELGQLLVGNITAEYVPFSTPINMTLRVYLSFWLLLLRKAWEGLGFRTWLDDFVENSWREPRDWLRLFERK
jgi:hypothetical protein